MTNAGRVIPGRWSRAQVHIKREHNGSRVASSSPGSGASKIAWTSARSRTRTCDPLINRLLVRNRIVANSLNLRQLTALQHGEPRTAFAHFHAWVGLRVTLRQQWITRAWAAPSRGSGRGRKLPLRLQVGYDWAESRALVEGGWEAWNFAYHEVEERRSIGRSSPRGRTLPRSGSRGSPSVHPQASAARHRALEGTGCRARAEMGGLP